MKLTNQTAVSEFLLLGLTDDPELHPLIFSLFLSMYLVTILGNLLITLAISSDSHLDTPMYFFLSSLSFTGISLGLENCLLAVMAYDCYVAICHHLRYTVIMHPHLCVLLVLLSLFISTVYSLLHTLMALWLSFCTDLEIPHFFCELAQVSSSPVLIPSSITAVVSLFYGTGFGVYESLADTDSSIKNIVATMMYTVIPPMLNLLIYSLRNKEMKGAMRSLIVGISFV
ncbi:Olfactory receptor 7G1 [Heterocephalus glaber]|uniref:Olfactory receptor 7G1 n=1 Tax=Heterocephalus glaber TaxID=10181 RepID=G5AXP8_HETGA|nr:Olfactory receptor 7G1 [Heterocephalus glaber]